MNTLFPLFIKPDQLNILIVGGGYVGLEKAEALLLNSPEAKITLVAPFIRDETRDFISDYPQVQMYEKPYEATDLEAKDIVIGATDDPELHKQIRAEARARSILVNIADTPELCDFYMSSIAQKGDLKVAISSNGKSPTFTKRFKEILNDVLDDDTSNLLNNLQKIRSRLKGDFSYKVKTLNKLTEGMLNKKTDQE